MGWGLGFVCFLFSWFFRRSRDISCEEKDLEVGGVLGKAFFEF